MVARLTHPPSRGSAAGLGPKGGRGAAFFTRKRLACAGGAATVRDVDSPPTDTLAPAASQHSHAHEGPTDLSADLRELSAHYAERAVPLGDILDRLGARASAILVVICALPFSTPISIPGLSTPFGFVILLLATRYFLGLPPWLPARLRRVVLPASFFSKVLSASAKLVGWLERRLKPGRLPLLADREWKLRLHTGAVIISALLLMLPIPAFPPFTNTLPALTAVVLTFATLKRDGAGILAGHGVFLFTIGYFIFWGAVVVEVIQRYGHKALELFERLFG